MGIAIKPWKLEAAEQLAGIINNQKVQDNIRDGIPFPYTVPDAIEYISAMLSADQNNTFSWAITDEDQIVGNIGVFRKDNVHRLTAEMGYFIGEEHWGKQFATTAVKLAAAYIFENTDIVRIFADPFAFNMGSCRVLEKAGFEYEGLLKKAAIKNGRIVDMKMYALVKKELDMHHIRWARQEDIENISKVLAASWKTAYLDMIHDEYLEVLGDDHWVSFLFIGLADENLFSAVITEGDEIIGAAILFKENLDNKVNLVSLYLRPDKIGQGIGHEFYSWIENQLKRMKFSSCTLDVLGKNERAITFYERHGFAATGETVMAVLGGTSYTCIVLEKTL